MIIHSYRGRLLYIFFYDFFKGHIWNSRTGCWRWNHRTNGNSSFCCFDLSRYESNKIFFCFCSRRSIIYLTFFWLLIGTCFLDRLNPPKSFWSTFSTFENNPNNEKLSGSKVVNSLRVFNRNYLFSALLYRNHILFYMSHKTFNFYQIFFQIINIVCLYSPFRDHLERLVSKVVQVLLELR